MTPQSSTGRAEKSASEAPRALDELGWAAVGGGESGSQGSEDPQAGRPGRLEGIC